MDELDKLYDTKKLMELSLSYSRVSDFDRNGSKALVVRDFVDNDGAKIGSIVDDLLTNNKNFDKIYYLFDGNKPTATLGKLCDIVLKNYNKLPNKKVILQICKDNEFWKRSSDEVLYKNFDNDEFWDYLKAQYSSKKKVLITTEELVLSKELADILKTHSYSKDIFNNDNKQIDQYKFEIEYKNFKFRGVIDKVIIDEKNKTVQLLDLKTGANPAEEFMTSFIKWRYYFQEAIYMKAFKKICKDFNLKGYSLLPFQFLYISRFEKIPLLYTVTKKWHNAAINGFTTNSGYNYRGLDEILDNIKWHITNKIYNIPKKIHESNGSVILEDNFITVNN